MEIGGKMKELNMTVEEINRLTNAFKDENFREMLCDYAQELSDPENKKRYEEEIKLLEQERGNTIDFIHPEPFRAVRTSVNGRHKCFINICASEKVGKPECKWGVSEAGCRGQCWSLPHSLHPGRQDTDPKGNRIMIYDVIFHPDTLNIASKNKKFMDMVDSTAMEQIQKAFKVTLDINNVRELSTKYKGTPQSCVIRKPIAGYKTKEPSEKPDPLAFPYPDDKTPSTSSQSNPTESQAKNSSAKPESFQSHPQETRKPTEPSYTVKYRSFIDLQDFRYSRDSAQSPRPKEMVVTIDMPLLKSAADASLEVKERRLLLESKKPVYRLELPLSYPVDEDKGEAKFNKQRRQLTVTLPVRPSTEAFDFAVGLQKACVSDGVKSEVHDEDTWEEEEKEGQESEEGKQRGVEEEDLKPQARAEKGEEEEGRGEERGDEQVREEQEGVAGEERVVEEEEKWREQKRHGQEGMEEKSVEEQMQEDQKEVGKLKLEKKHRCGDTGTASTLRADGCDVSVTGNQPVKLTAEHAACKVKEGGLNLESGAESTPEVKTSNIKEDTEKVEPGAACQHHGSTEESQTAAAAVSSTQRDNLTGWCRGGSGNKELAEGSVKREERESIGEDDLQMEIFQNPAQDDKPPPPPPVLLREIDKDGNETVISDHSTSAGFLFQNSLMFELD